MKEDIEVFHEKLLAIDRAFAPDGGNSMDCPMREPHREILDSKAIPMALPGQNR